jgi:hypothetical protein
MMRWKPALGGARARCEIVDITAAGRGAGGANRPTYLPALHDISVACGIGDGHREIAATSGHRELRPAKTLCSLPAIPYIALIPGHHPLPAARPRGGMRSATETD